MPSKQTGPGRPTNVTYEQNAKVTAFVHMSISCVDNSAALWYECGPSYLKTIRHWCSNQYLVTDIVNKPPLK